MVVETERTRQRNGIDDAQVSLVIGSSGLNGAGLPGSMAIETVSVCKLLSSKAGENKSLTVVV